MNSRWAMIVAMVIPLCGTAAAQGRGGGAPGGAPAGPAQGGVTQGGVPQGGVPPGGGRGQFPVVPPGGAGFGSFPFGKSGGPSSSWGGRKGHGSGQVAPWAYTNVTTVLPPPYGPPPAPSFNDQAPDNWPPQVPPMMVQGPPPGWDPELNAYGPAPRQSFGMRTIQAPPAPPPAPLPEEFPALLVLKNGRMASVAKYGISGDTLYFVTPLGDSEQVPVALLDHIYPAMKQRRPVGDAAAPPASLNRN